ncbi:MAG: hypothetical protein ABI128_09090 [Rhodanobacter sp.]
MSRLPGLPNRTTGGFKKAGGSVVLDIDARCAKDHRQFCEKWKSLNRRWSGFRQVQHDALQPAQLPGERSAAEHACDTRRPTSRAWMACSHRVNAGESVGRHVRNPLQRVVYVVSRVVARQPTLPSAPGIGARMTWS